jgi:hypothetical protein
MKNWLILFLLPVNVLFDVLLIFFEGGGALPILRAAAMLALIGATLIRHEKNKKFYAWTIVFAIYCLVNVLFSTDWNRSLNITLKVLIPMLSFAIGFNSINTIKKLIVLNKSVVFVFVVLIINYLVSQTLGIGKSVYTGGSDFLVGGMDDNWNVFTYSVLITPLIVYFMRRQRLKRIWVLSLSVITAMMVVISLKRIAITGLLAGNFIRFTFAPKVLVTIRVLLGIILFLMVSLPFYEDLIKQRIDARSSRFEQGALERESRYLETAYVWDEVFSFENPVKSIFGLQGFNSVGNYASGRFGARNLHVDYNLIINTIGIIGFLLYFFVFIDIFKKFRKYYFKSPLDIEVKKELKATFYMLFITPFITSLAGQMYHISYRLIVFIYLGSIIGILYQSSYAGTRSLQRQLR